MGAKENIPARCGRTVRKVLLGCTVVCNRLKMRLFGVHFGPSCRVEGRLLLERKDGAQITVGSRFHCISGAGVNRLGRNLRSGIFAGEGAVIRIGDGVGMSCSTLWARSSITIGNHVNIGADCMIMDHDAHSLYYLHRRDYSVDRQHIASKPVTIGNDVLLGARCVVLKGVTIGDRSVVGAGSVVTGDIPPDQVWAGNPARFIHPL